MNWGPKIDNNVQFAAKSPWMTNTAMFVGLNPNGIGWAWGPSSDHSGGVVLHAWGDAHVTAIPDTTDATLYIQLVTRAGREPVGDPNDG